MTGAGAGHDLPVGALEPGLVTGHQGLHQGQGAHLTEHRRQVVVEILAGAREPVGTGARVESLRPRVLADGAGRLDPLLEEPALEVEAARIGKAMARFQAHRQPPPLTGTHRGRPVVPGDPDQAGEG